MSTITIPCTLSVKNISGRYGEFNVATIQSPLGQFSSSDDVLETIDEGIYENAIVEISFFELRNYPTKSGKLITEINADLISVSFDNDTIDEVDDDFDVDIPIKTHSPVIAPAVSKTEQCDDNFQSSESLTDIFPTELLPLGNEVKLDPTIKRALLKQQTAYLKAHAYCFIPTEQVWRLNT